MSEGIKAADARFLLPELPEVFAAVDLDEDRHRAWAATVEEVAAGDPRLASGGVLVGRSDATGQLASSGAAQVVVYDDCPRPVRTAGYEAARWLVIGEDLLEGYLPLDRRVVGRHATAHWRRPATALRRVAARAAVEMRWAPGGRQVVTVGSRSGGPISMLGHAIEAGLVPSGCFAALDSPGMSEGSRLTALVFAPGQSEPSWALKFGRHDAARAAFEGEARAFAMLAEHPTLAEHAPRLLGHFSVAGLPAGLETYAGGEGLHRVMAQQSERQNLAIIDRIAAWLQRTCIETLHPLGAADSWLDGHLVERVHSVAGAAASLDTAMATVAHNDPGPWNIRIDGDQFHLLDWESASASTPPLWDLSYFLTEACTLAAGASTVEDRVRTTIALFRGDHVLSPVLLGHLRAAADRLALTDAQAGGLVLASWLHHSVPPDRDPLVAAEFVADAWLEDPALGTDWSLP